MKVEHVQSFFLSAGNESCCALCIADCAREWCAENGAAFPFANEQAALEAGIEGGFIFFNFADYADKKNFLVQDAAGFMQLMTGRRWQYSFAAADYRPKAGEKIIEFWALDRANADRGVGHFVRPGMNTLQKSRTVAEGKCYGKRVLRPRG